MIAAVEPELAGAAPRDRRDRAARPPRRARPARPLQRARPHALGRASRPAARRSPRGGFTAFFDMPLNSIAADDRRRGLRREARGGASATRASTSASGAASCPATRPPRGARRARRDRLQGVHVQQRHRRVPARRRRDALRGHGDLRQARPARRRPRRERRADGPRDRPHGARLHGLAPADRRARGDQPRDRVRRGHRLPAAHRPRVIGPRRRARHRGARAEAST